MGTRPANVDKLLPQYPDFFKQNRLDHITEEDLQRSINMYLSRMMFRRLSSINQVYYLAHSFYFHQKIDYDKIFFDGLKNIKLTDVRRVMDKYMNVKNPISVVIR